MVFLERFDTEKRGYLKKEDIFRATKVYFRSSEQPTEEEISKLLAAAKGYSETAGIPLRRFASLWVKVLTRQQELIEECKSRLGWRGARMLIGGGWQRVRPTLLHLSGGQVAGHGQVPSRRRHGSQGDDEQHGQCRSSRKPVHADNMELRFFLPRRFSSSSFLPLFQITFL